MNILKMVMFETNGATEMPAKPYELDLRHGTGDIIEELDELTVGGTNVNSMALSRLASGILVPSTAPRATRIDGGWTERRIMFAMVVEVQGSSTGNYSDIRYITGYTDRSDYSNQRGRVHFPDDMRLYFNSIVRISLNQVSSRGGRRTLPTIRDNNLLLRRDSIISERGRDRGIRDNRPSLLRPADVLKRASSSHYIKDMLSTIPDSISKNTVGKFNLSTQLSKRKNNNSAEHMTTTLKSYMYARSHGEDDATNAGFPISRDGESLDIEPDYMVSAATSAIAAEDTMGSDPLFDEMRRFTNILEDGYIEWGELKRMAPDFDEDRDLPFTPWNARERTLTRSSRGSMIGVSQTTTTQLPSTTTHLSPSQH